MAAEIGRGKERSKHRTLKCRVVTVIYLTSSSLSRLLPHTPKLLRLPVPNAWLRNVGTNCLAAIPPTQNCSGLVWDLNSDPFVWSSSFFLQPSTQSSVEAGKALGAATSSWLPSASPCSLNMETPAGVPFLSTLQQCHGLCGSSHRTSVVILLCHIFRNSCMFWQRNSMDKVREARDRV